MYFVHHLIALKVTTHLWV